MMIKKITASRVLKIGLTLNLLISFGCREPLPLDPSYDTEVSVDTSVTCAEQSARFFNNADNPYFGGDSAEDVVVVHFSNFSCSHCAVFAEDTHDLWEQRLDFKERVRIYFHHYPFSSETNWEQHQAAVAAGNQGMEHFWAVHDYIYEGILQHNYYTAEDLFTFIDETLQLDMTQFQADFAAEKTKAFLEQDFNQGTLAGVTGTPTVFVCGQLIQRSNLEEAIDSVLK